MVNIIFGTLTGNTQRVAEFVKAQVDMSGESSVINRAEDVDISVFDNKEDKYVVMASTWNLGEMNQFITHLFEKLSETDLNGVHIAFVGLGDKIYGEDHFCRSIIDFRELALAQGASELVDPLYIDGEPEMVMDTQVKDWTEKLIEKLKKS